MTTSNSNNTTPVAAGVVDHQAARAARAAQASQTSHVTQSMPAINESVYRFQLLEGARAILALWVVVSHILAIVGFSYEQSPPMLMLAMSSNFAVDVFVIISGFVITHLLTIKQESYGVYITRRFLRLWPLHIFLVLVIVGLMLVANGPPDALYDQYSAASEDHFAWLLAANATMLHGLIPDAWIMHGANFFNSPAWSISLEWQFYLVAPWIIITLRRWPLVAVGIVTTIVLLRPTGGWMSHGAFLPEHIEFFALGILTRIWWPQLATLLQQIKPKKVLLALLFVLVCSNLLTPILHWKPVGYEPSGFISLWIWMLLCLLLTQESLHAVPDGSDSHADNKGAQKAVAAHQSSSRVIRGLVGFLSCKPMLLLGAWSYSIYLTHMLLIRLSVWGFGEQLATMGLRDKLLWLLPSQIILVIAVSACTYYLIERPGILVGKRLFKEPTQ